MMRILGNRVLVALPPKEQETKTDSGLVLVRDPDRKQQTRGVVVALGERRGVVDLDDVRSEIHTYALDQEERCASEDMGGWHQDVDRLLMKMAPSDFDVQVGDVVLFPASAGEVLPQGGVDCVLLHESEILCVLGKAAEQSAWLNRLAHAILAALSDIQLKEDVA